MTDQQSIVIRIGGESGEGVITVGDIFTRAAARSGYWVYTFQTFPAEIKGGNVVFQVRVGVEPVTSVGDEIDVLVALTEETRDKYYDALRKGGTFIYNSDRFAFEGDSEKQPNVFAVPFDAMAKEAGLDVKAGANMLVVGALAAFFGLSQERVSATVERRLGKRADLLEANLRGIDAGYEWAKANLTPPDDVHLAPAKYEGGDRMIMKGNEALSMGAVAAGVAFFGGYPITPASDIMEFLARELPKFGGTLVQAEDEMSAIAMCLGASYAGARAMTATSGPGLALMQELIGHASMSEVPVTLINVQRAGPSTGMPTKTAQADLLMTIHGSNDEAPRIVLAATDVEDCFYQAANGVNLAERYQMPVFILSDQSLAFRTETTSPIDESRVHHMERVVAAAHNDGTPYLRYRITENGISAMALPGTPGAYHIAEGLEHLETGAPDYEPDQHIRMMDKRFRKLETAYQECRDFDFVYETFGVEGEADLGIISWGTTAGPVQEAVARQVKAGRKIAAFIPKMLYPVLREELAAFAARCKTLLVAEQNAQGQLARLLLMEMSLQTERLNKYDGLAFEPGQVEAKIVELLD